MGTVAFLTYLTVFLFGITVGSFLNVCILRIPEGQSIVTVPSHCMSCGKRLRWYELIPVFSYIFLRGRCSVCGCRISAQYPLIEALNGALWILLFARFGPSALFLLSCLLTSALLVIGVIDARTREIPPGTNIFILVLGAIHLITDAANWQLYAIGFLAVSLPLLIILLATGGRGIGGGDVKLMAVCGLFLGWKCIVLAFFLACLLGSVIHLSLMAAGKADRSLALGPYLALGVFLSLMWGERMIGWYLGMFL